MFRNRNIDIRMRRHLTGGGFALVSAIFLLVVLTALGAYMVTISTVQHTTSMLDIQGSRAYQAARAGVEWGVFQTSNGVCTGTANLPALAGDLTTFTVTVAFAATPYAEGNENRTLCQITSTATSGQPGAVDRVDRQIQLIVDRNF